VSSGVEAEIALDTTIVLGLGVTRAVGGAAGLAAAGAGALASMAELQAEEREAALRPAERYEATIREVLDVNARIAALAESLDRARDTYAMSVDVPALEPLPLAAQPNDELTAWCARTTALLDEVEVRVSAALTAAVTERLFAAGSGSGGLHAAETDTGDSGETADSRAAPDLWRDETAESVTRVVGRLATDAAEEDRGDVRETAERVAAAVTPGDAEGQLTELRIRVQRANARAADRRHGIAAAARFLRELPASADTAAVRAALVDVVAGRRALDDTLRAAALQHVETVQAEAERRYVVDTIAAAFGAMGYEVSEGFETLTSRDGDIVLTRGDWPQHAVRLRVDDPSGPGDQSRPRPQGTQVRLAMVRTEPGTDANDRRLDVEREQQWCEAFEAARERLSEAGIRADVRRREEPGTRTLPVDSRRSRGRRRTAGEQRHERERDIPT
jgi:hypothetical protein